MTIYAYYETDGDAGWYAVTLFSTKKKAEVYKKAMDSAYGNIDELIVDDPKTLIKFRMGNKKRRISNDY
jgi:hypothetical protein